MAQFLRNLQQERALQERDETMGRCYSPHSLQTPLNTNDLIPTYNGIMFDVVALTDEIEVTSIEFDAKVDEVTDMRVEVFSREGLYEDYIDDESAWEKIADTEAIASTDRQTLRIPYTAFKPTSISQGKQRSFYISMQGPWIDSVAKALDKTGEIQTKNDDLGIHVGVGLSERFPTNFDTTVDPQFSGTLHYMKLIDCQKDFSTTSVTIQLITPKSEDLSFFSQLTQNMHEAVTNNLLKSSPFRDMVSEHGLVFSKDSETTRTNQQVDCPQNWDVCPRKVVSSTLIFKHSANLDSGKLTYEVSRFAESLVNKVAKMSGVSKMLYLGRQPMTAEFDLTFQGLPNTPVTACEIDHLENTLTSFLSTSFDMKGNDVRVLSTAVSHMDETAKASGTIFGQQASYLQPDNFGTALTDIVLENNSALLDELRVGARLCADIEGKQSRFFRDVSSVSSSFTVKVPSAGVLNEPSLISVNMFFALLLLIFPCFFCCFWSWKRSKRYYRNRIDPALEIHKGGPTLDKSKSSRTLGSSFTSLDLEGEIMIPTVDAAPAQTSLLPSGASLGLKREGSFRSLNGMDGTLGGNPGLWRNASSRSLHGDARALTREGSESSIENPGLWRDGSSRSLRGAALPRQGSFGPGRTLDRTGSSSSGSAHQEPPIRSTQRHGSTNSLANLRENSSNGMRRATSLRSMQEAMLLEQSSGQPRMQRRNPHQRVQRSRSHEEKPGFRRMTWYQSARTVRSNEEQSSIQRISSHRPVQGSRSRGESTEMQRMDSQRSMQRSRSREPNRQMGHPRMVQRTNSPEEKRPYESSNQRQKTPREMHRQQLMMQFVD